MADNRITRQRLRNHWTYSWWKYLLVAMLAVLGTNLFFAATAYRPADDKKIELYLCNGSADAQAMQEMLWPLLLEVAPDQEELVVLSIDLSGGDMYTTMQFTTYTAAQQGDICLLPSSEMRTLAADEPWYAFVDLTPYLESGALDVKGIDTSAYEMLNETGETAVYGIPTDNLYGLLQYGIDPADGVLVVMGYTLNEENAVRLVHIMMDELSTEKPEGYDEWRDQFRESQTGGTQIFQ